MIRGDVIKINYSKNDSLTIRLGKNRKEVTDHNNPVLGVKF